MAKKKKIEVIDPILTRVTNFHKRWGIEISDEERWDSFHSRVLNAFTFGIGKEIIYDTLTEDEFLDLLGVHFSASVSALDMVIQYDRKFLDSPVYLYLRDTKDIKKFLFALECIFWMERLDYDKKFDFLEKIKEIIVLTGIPIEVVETDESVLFYPAGAKLLDEKLVNDNLNWLSEFPDSYEPFKIAITNIGIKGKERHVVDSLRLSLELLFKSVLKNSKSLENQKEELGKFLKSKGTSPEISNLFWVVQNYYLSYQNSNAKHNNSVNSTEVEFILYLTGTLMRFLITCK